ncbi:MAG TPA: YEATS-associated helix-containing protein [Rhodocyclaceae bacterium]|nr:YEATS-associated helix-containing protein [Rhodocyclaceae bacterium]
MDPLISIAAVMFASGALGGLVNYFISDTNEEKQLTWWQHVFVGVVAAYIVPLFLNMASGDLIDKIRGVDGKAPDYSRLFVLAGFCLVAAASSRAFIRSLSERILQEARAANRKADEAKEQAAEAQATVAPLVEDDVPTSVVSVAEESAAREVIARSEAPRIELSELERKVLKAMADSGFSMRSMTGIARDSAMSRVHVSTTLNSLIAKGLVLQGKSSSSDQPRWSLSSVGRVTANDSHSD